MTQRVKYAVLSGAWDYLNGHTLTVYDSLELARQKKKASFGDYGEVVMLVMIPVRPEHGPPPLYTSPLGRPWTQDDEDRMEHRRED